MAQFIINFPISTEHAENDYCLAVCFNAANADEIITVLQNDWRSYSNLVIDESSSVKRVSCNGTLTGDTVIKDDTRENILVPICSSKLTFNMLCAEFPAWLLEQCNYYTSVKVILYAMQGTTNRVKWRGFLWDNALNMTVVDELQSCTLVALDEVAISKYIKISETWTSSNRKRRTLPLLQYFTDYWNLIHTEFAKLYQQIGLTTLGKLQVNRSIAYIDDFGVEQDDFLSNVYLANSMYFDDEEKTWQDALSDIAEILGCTWLVGGYGTGDFDGYLLSSYDEINVGENFDRYVYDLINDTVSHHQGSYRAITQHNPQKIGADLQITIEPAKYKEVKVVTDEQRFKSHEYLKDEVMKPIEGSTSATKNGIVRRWGVYDNSTLKDLKYHHFQYCDFDSKEDDFISFSPCVNSESAKELTEMGYLPDDTFDFTSVTRPDESVADGMQFVQSKIGAFPCRIGEYEQNDVLIRKDLSNYIILLNNKWSRTFYAPGAIDSQDQTAIILVDFMPRGLDNLIHPSNEHFLKIDFSALFLTENMIYDPAIPGSTLITDLIGRDEIAFPSESTHYDYSNEDYACNGIMKQYTKGNIYHGIYSGSPYISTRISVGNNSVDSNLQWFNDAHVYQVCNIHLVSDSDVEVNFLPPSGSTYKSILNYFYNQCRPRAYQYERCLYIPISSSGSALPFSGQLKLTMYGQIPFFNYSSVAGYVSNNTILAALLKDIDISFTDQAEINGEESTRTETRSWDNSPTKETLEVSPKLCTPLHDGFFTNAMLYDGGKSWYNVSSVIYQGDNVAASMEFFVLQHYVSVMRLKPTFLEFSMFFNPWDNIHNLENRFADFREFAGTFVPLERTFTINKDLVRYKLQLLQ